MGSIKERNTVDFIDPLRNQIEWPNSASITFEIIEVLSVVGHLCLTTCFIWANHYRGIWLSSQPATIWKLSVFYAIIFRDRRYSQLLNTKSSSNVWAFLQQKNIHGGTSSSFVFLRSFLQASFDIANWATQSRNIDQHISYPLWTQMTNIIMHDMMESKQFSSEYQDNVL